MSVIICPLCDSINVSTWACLSCKCVFSLNNNQVENYVFQAMHGYFLYFYVDENRITISKGSEMVLSLYNVTLDTFKAMIQDKTLLEKLLLL